MFLANVFLKQPSKCLQDITTKLLHDHKSSQVCTFHGFSRVSHVHCTFLCFLNHIPLFLEPAMQLANAICMNQISLLHNTFSSWPMQFV